MKRAALLIIDMQNDFVGEEAILQVADAKRIIPKIQKALELFRSRNLPVIHVLRVHKKDGSDVEIFRRHIFKETPFAVEGTRGAAVIDGLTPKSGEYELKKTRMSAFVGTPLDLILRSQMVDIVVVAGIQTPNCIRTTVFDAMAYNYHTCLVDDATGAQNDEIHQSNVRDMRNIGVVILQAEDLPSFLDESGEILDTY